MLRDGPRVGHKGRGAAPRLPHSSAKRRASRIRKCLAQVAANGSPLATVAGRMQHTKATHHSDHRPNAHTTQLGDAPPTITPLQSWPISPARVLVVDDDPTFCEFVNDA